MNGIYLFIAILSIANCVMAILNKNWHSLGGWVLNVMLWTVIIYGWAC